MFNLFRYSSAVKSLRKAIPLVAESFKEAGYPERVQDVYDNIELNEGGLALEILCENLYEFSCPVPQRAYALIKESGTAMEIDSRYWGILEPLVAG